MASVVHEPDPDVHERPTGAQQRAAEWLRAYGEYLCAGDVPRIVELFHPDAVVVPGPLEAPIVGRAAIERFYADVFTAAEVHDIVWSAPLYGGTHASAEWWATLSEHGKRASEPGSLHFEIDEDGRCRSWRAYPFVADGVREIPSGWPRGIGR